MTSLLESMSTQRIVLCAGPGGVGKTTMSASLGLAAARAGRKVCVLTIDPARRLADALGVELGNEPRAVNIEPLQKTGVAVPGELHALMLDPQETLYSLIRSNAPNAEVADRVFDNVIFKQLSGAMAGTLEYTAIEKLYDLYSNYDYDLIVVDTPPSKNVLDFLEAPEYVARFLEESIFKWFVILDPGQPASSFAGGLVKRTGKLIWDVLGKTLGEDFVDELGKFLRAMEFLAAEFRRRAVILGKLLRSKETLAMVVATTDRFVMEDASYLCAEIQKRKIPFGGFVVNRTQIAPGVGDLTLATESILAAVGDDPGAEGLVGELKNIFDERVLKLEREAKALETLRIKSKWRGMLTKLPLQNEEIHDLMGLNRLAVFLGAPRA